MITARSNLSFGTVILLFLTFASQALAQFAYVVNNGSHDVSGFKVKPNGSLTPLPGSPFPAGTQPTSIAVDPTGSFAYVTNAVDASVSEYKITGGTLAPNGTVFAGTQPASVAVDHTGHCAYVANPGSSNVSQYKIDATGKLAPLGAYSMGLVSPDWLAVHPAGNLVVVADKGTSMVYARSTTNCTLQSGNSKMSDSQPETLMVWVPGTSCVFIPAKGSDKLVGYFLNGMPPNYLAQPIEGFPISLPAGSQPQSVAAWSSQPKMKNAFLYVADNGSNKISGYLITAKCQLIRQLPGSPFSAGSAPVSIAIGPQGRFAYVVNEGDNDIWQYQIDGHGSLIFVAKVQAGAAPVEILIH